MQGAFIYSICCECGNSKMYTNQLLWLLLAWVDPRFQNNNCFHSLLQTTWWRGVHWPCCTAWRAAVWSMAETNGLSVWTLHVPPIYARTSANRVHLTLEPDECECELCVNRPCSIQTNMLKSGIKPWPCKILCSMPCSGQLDLLPLEDTVQICWLSWLGVGL